MRTKTCASIVSGAVCLIFAAGVAFAQSGRPSPQRGHELAMRLCTTCHGIDGEASRPMRADVPSFPVIAGRPWATAEYLTARIMMPHSAMPSVPLTAGEIRDIVAYILTLKRND